MRRPHWLGRGARLEQKLDQLLAMTAGLKAEEDTMAKTLDDVLADVTAEVTADQSLITLCNGLSAQLKAALAAGDTAKVQQIADQLEANTATVVAAVNANTTPTPPPAA